MPLGKLCLCELLPRPKGEVRAQRAKSAGWLRVGAGEAFEAVWGDDAMQPSTLQNTQRRGSVRFTLTAFLSCSDPSSSHPALDQFRHIHLRPLS